MLKRDMIPVSVPCGFDFFFSVLSSLRIYKRKILVTSPLLTEGGRALKKIPGNMRDIFGYLVAYFQSFVGLINSRRITAMCCQQTPTQLSV